MLTYTAFLHLYPHPRRSMQTSASVDAQPPKPYNNTIVRQT